MISFFLQVIFMYLCQLYPNAYVALRVHLSGNMASSFRRLFSCLVSGFLSWFSTGLAIDFATIFWKEVSHGEVSLGRSFMGRSLTGGLLWGGLSWGDLFRSPLFRSSLLGRSLMGRSLTGRSLLRRSHTGRSLLWTRKSPYIGLQPKANSDKITANI